MFNVYYAHAVFIEDFTNTIELPVIVFLVTNMFPVHYLYPYLYSFF